LRGTSAAASGQTLRGSAARDIALRYRSLSCPSGRLPGKLEATLLHFPIGLKWLQKIRMKHMSVTVNNETFVAKGASLWLDCSHETALLIRFPAKGGF
jgi:hypothetical protein